MYPVILMDFQPFSKRLKLRLRIRKITKKNIFLDDNT